MKRSISSILLIGLQFTSGFVTLNHHKSSASIRSVLMAMPELPADVEMYSQVPALASYFTDDYIPKGLLKGHSTKDGTWGVIRIHQGRLQYNLDGDESFELTPSEPGIIQPNIKHSVKSLSEDLEFVVEFYRLPLTGPVDEPREGL
jgi:tellurite resistance-related uncharacterized protein